MALCMLEDGKSLSYGWITAPPYIRISLIWNMSAEPLSNEGVEDVIRAGLAYRRVVQVCTSKQVQLKAEVEVLAKAEHHFTKPEITREYMVPPK